VDSWREGRLYRLETAPGRVSDIMLEPGEALISVAAGDTARWIIGETSSGSGPGRRTHVLVKPTEAGLATNIIIATDRRVFHVEAASSGGASMASLSWTYPDDALLAIRTSAGLAGSGAMEFGYSIEGDRPPWRPVRAFDDGEHVFIEFPPGLAQDEAPPLFVRPAEGGTALVNYRVRGRYYIVDRLFSEAELRLGEKPQQVVRIVRADAGHGRRRGS
jgi:type IV secretion system protein VirB9